MKVKRALSRVWCLSALFRRAEIGLPMDRSGNAASGERAAGRGIYLGRAACRHGQHRNYFQNEKRYCGSSWRVRRERYPPVAGIGMRALFC